MTHTQRIAELEAQINALTPADPNADFPESAQDVWLELQLEKCKETVGVRAFQTMIKRFGRDGVLGLWLESPAFTG